MKPCAEPCNELRPSRRTDPERPAIRDHAVSHGRRIDAGVRGHGADQPGPWLALHDRRVRGRGRCCGDRVVPAWSCRRTRCRRNGGRSHRNTRHQAPLRPRSPGPGPGNLCADSDLFRSHPLGVRVLPALSRRTGLAVRLCRVARRRGLPPLPPGADRHRACGRARALLADRTDTAWHPHPRRGSRPRDDCSAWCRYHPPIHGRFRPWRGACRTGRRLDRCNPVGSGRHGGAGPDTRFRCYRDRRHRVDPRRVGRRAAGWIDRHARARLPAGRLRVSDASVRGHGGRVGPCVDVDLPPHGGGARRPARRAVRDGLRCFGNP